MDGVGHRPTVGLDAGDTVAGGRQAVGTSSLAVGGGAGARRQHGAEQPDAAVGIEERTVNVADGRGGQIHQYLGTIGATLEERAGRDPQASTGDLLVVEGLSSRCQLVVSDHDHVFGQLNAFGRRMDDHHALAGASSNPDRDLVGLTETTVDEDLLDKGMSDQTGINRDNIVRPRASIAGPAVTDGGSNRGAVSLRVEFRPEANVGALQPAESLKAIEHDRPSKLSLGVRLRMLPIASATAVTDVAAWLVPPTRCRRHHLNGRCFHPGPMLGGGNDPHPFAGQRPGDEDDTSVRSGAESGTAGSYSVQFELELWHDDEAMGTNDPVIPPILIVPSVLPADFSKLGDECRDLEAAGVDRIQFDVMDGRFVPNLTFGPDVIASVRDQVKVPFEAHLMIEEPDHLIPRFVEAGCETIIVHAETTVHLHRTLSAVRELGASPAIALNPHTPLDVVANVLDLCDMLLVMTVNPGFGGQAYIQTMEPKIRAARALLDTADRWIDLEVDGGISPSTIDGAADAGANVFISGSALYRHEGGLGAATEELRQLAGKAWANRA